MISRIVNTKGLFFGNCEEIEFLNEGNTYKIVGTEDVKETKVLFDLNNIKRDNRKGIISPDSIYQLRYCFHNDVMLSMNCAIKNPHIRVYGSQEVVDGLLQIMINENLVKLPPVCFVKSKKLVGPLFKKLMIGLKIDLKDTDFYYPEIIIKCNKAYIQSIQKDRLERFDGDFWNKELRRKYAVDTKINKWMLTNTTIKESDLDNIVNHIDGIELPVILLEGEGIYNGYIKSKVLMKSTIASSCMMGKNKAFFKIYVDNAQMAVLKNEDGLITCRAILWDVKIKSGKKIKLLDRIYYTEDQQVGLMNSWANKHGIYHLVENDYNNSHIMLKDKKISLEGAYVDIKNVNGLNKYPYLDTFFKLVGNKLYRYFDVKELKYTDGTTRSH